MNHQGGLTTNPFDDDKLHEECGIFAVHGHKDAAALTALGLHALQHRGQEACGIVTSDGSQFHSHRALGQVGDNFSSQRVIDALPGRLAIGHNRYATTGETILRNVQPLFAEFDFGGFAIGHNGNLTNAAFLRRLLVRQGCLFHSTTDTEVIHHLMARAHGDVETRLLSALNQVEGAYSLVAIDRDRIIGVRDPLGVRPLVLGRLDEAWILASETCAHAEGAGLPFELGIIRNHYVGRTFIEPTDQIRHLGVKLKHNANRAKLEGKRVILVDDSIVRGTTSKKIVEMVRSVGAAEVHMRISSPPTAHPCFYGIDTPQREKLLASRYDVDGMAKFIGVDSLAFISIDGLYRAMGQPGRDPAAPQYCDACFTGEYPTRLTDQEGAAAPAPLLRTASPAA
jgi:glutamine phosphoribosylpyrophosphate amidotransferase